MKAFTTDHDAHVRLYRLLANRIARANGAGRATEIVRSGFDGVVSHIKYGYRKYTTDQYVPNSYRAHFGWKNTYYQAAKTVVSIA